MIFNRKMGVNEVHNDSNQHQHGTYGHVKELSYHFSCGEMHETNLNWPNKE